MSNKGDGESIYDLLVREVEHSPQTPVFESTPQNTLSSLHDLLLQYDDTKYTPITPHVVLKPSKIKPYIGRRKWITPSTTTLTGPTSSINLLNGQLRHPLSNLPKHFVDQRSLDASLQDQGSIEQIPIHNYHRYINQRLSQEKPKQEEKQPSIPALVESFMDVLEDLATTHYYNDQYYNQSGFYYNMLFDTTQSMKRFYNHAADLYQHLFQDHVEIKKPKKHKKEFLKKLVKWVADHHQRVEDKISPREEVTRQQEEEETEYDATSFFSLSLMIHRLHDEMETNRATRTPEEIVMPHFHVIPPLARTFTIDEGMSYLQHLHERTYSLELLLSQIPDYLGYLRNNRFAQRLLIKKLLDEISLRSKQDKQSIDTPIQEHLYNITPELDEKTTLLWYMHMLAHCNNKQDKKWMKKLIIAYRYRDLLRDVISYIGSNISEKSRCLTIVDRRVFCCGWMRTSYPQAPLLARDVIKKLIT
jgi:transcription termination factor NusB